MTKAMKLVVTLVAPTPLDPARVAPLVRTLAADHAERLGPHAVDLLVEGEREDVRARLADALAGEAVDVIVQPVANRCKRLVICDMDSTLIRQECIDELAAVHDLKPKVAAITERAMKGELDFAEALVERVALLEGIPEASIARLLDTVITPSPGAETLAATCRAHGIRTVLVSGGFVQFAEPVAARLGIHAAYANTLLAADGVLTGAVAEPILGADAKRERLLAECEALGIATDDALAIGDGANDLAMMKTAGLGIAYRAKPKVEAAAHAAIRHTDLAAALYALGIPADAFAGPPSDHAEADREDEATGGEER
jgi:phosphoserine phosphatase